MEIIDTKKLRKVTEARAIIDNQQRRIWQLEQTLDDLARACEIAQYSQQYSITEIYRQASEEMLKDRITVPDQEQGPLKINIIEGSIDQSMHDQITAKAKVAAGIDD